ncbi:aldo/keto reductase [Hoeflea prorocentri]|uniref:Aldo/keto reductase n=1 Tax=Hoeflea prorocentri TaxID=1922333 RepID=A0A9X3ULU0_9HYPH|nr:aldo/keto reductase [Hoeflea prorocentri]MCY6383200.1 aldo/keto reductase [Hoeflea prorocentri]MDA5401000.1 aldo/keto reductase [Hoeflea prorocentri]
MNDTPLGMGSWALGGPFFSGEKWLLPKGAPLGYGKTSDPVSIRAIHCAIDHGAAVIDTADAYGTGHSERVIARALRNHRDGVLLATKFGNVIDERTKELIGTQWSEGYIRAALEASLRRLETDVIDIYQLHISELAMDEAERVGETLAALCREGKVRYYGWSTDDPERAKLLAAKHGAQMAQFNMNVLQPATRMVEMCEAHDLFGLVRLPLAMGFLSGKYTAQSSLPEDDIRSAPPPDLVYFESGGRANAEWAARRDAIRDILTSSGRTLAQGALAWLWAQSDRIIPIPGIRTEAQAKENFGARAHGPLLEEQVIEIDNILDRRV